MISAQTPRVCREGKPLQTFQDHAPMATASGDLQVFGRHLAAVLHEVIFHDLVFVEGCESRALDGRDMDEHVLVAAHRLDESVTLCRVEPFDGAFLHRHRLSPRLDEKKTRHAIKRVTPQTGFRKSAQFPSLGSQRRETHSRTANSDCAGIATRNLELSKLPAPLSESRFHGNQPWVGRKPVTSG